MDHSPGRGYFFVLEMVLLFERHRMGLKQSYMPQIGLKIYLGYFIPTVIKMG